MDNKEYAEILGEIASLQRVVGDGFFKVRAFSRAARLIEDLAEPIELLIDQRRLNEIPGIGESIEEELESLRKLGYSPRHEELVARVGPGVKELWDIPGLGIKRIQVLFQELQVASVAQLKAAAQAGRLARHAQFGAAVQSKLLHEIEGWERGRGRRYPLPEAKALADSLCAQMVETGEVDQAAVAGSIRRGKESIGDIDLLVTTVRPAWVSHFFKTLPEVVEIVFDGDARASVRITNEIQADLRIVEPHLFGAGLHYFTGDKDHHIQMRLRSKRMGLKISEKGVTHYHDASETPVGPMTTEEEVFAAVGLPYIPPEIRHGKDEIRLAESGRLPRLVSAEDLTGEVHVCTSLSKGVDALDEVLEGCARRGYRWLALTEQGGRDRGVRPNEYAEYARKVAQLDGRHGVRVLAGLEVEIQADGTLDYDHRALAHVPWVVGVFRGSEEPAQSLLWGLETGLVSCLAWPTGRRLGAHDGWGLDVDELVACCVDFGVALTVSGDPQRLDLNGTLARRCADLGAMLVLTGSATSVDGLRHIDYAVQQARRGWMTPAEVLNTREIDDVLERTRVLVR